MVLECVLRDRSDNFCFLYYRVFCVMRSGRYACIADLDMSTALHMLFCSSWIEACAMSFIFVSRATHKSTHMLQQPTFVLQELSEGCGYRHSDTRSCPKPVRMKCNVHHRLLRRDAE